MKTKAEMKKEYKETPIPMGVFLVHNTRTHKFVIGAQGVETFEFKVLDTLKPKEEPGWDPGEDLKALESMWLEELKRRGWTPY